MKDNALIPKHVDEMHPRFTSNLKNCGMVMPVIQMMADIQKAEKWRDSSTH